MDRIVEETMNIVENYMDKAILDMTVRSVRNSVIKGNAPSSKYDYLTVREFLALYKIEKLEEFGKINSTQSDNLKDLVLMSAELKKQAGRLTYNELFEGEKDIKSKYAIKSSKEKVDEVLKDNNLIIEKRIFSKAVDSLIKAESTNKKASKIRKLEKTN